MNSFKEVLAQFKNLWLRMDGAQRLSVLFFGGGIFLLMVTFMVVSTEPAGRQILFSSVPLEQAQAILSRLKSDGYDAKYSDGKITISSEDDASAILPELAAENLLPQKIVYDFNTLIKDRNFQDTRPERKRNYIIALSNHLSMNLTAWDFIEDAKVTIPPEEESPLLKQHLHRTASVMLRTASGQRLGKRKIEAIANYVARSVRGLEPENVAITDTRGRSYNHNTEFDATDKFSLISELQRREEERLEAYLETFIPKVKVRISLDVNLGTLRQQGKTFDHPDLGKKAEVRTETINKSEKSNSTEGSQGVPGAGTNAEGTIEDGDGGIKTAMEKKELVEKTDNSQLTFTRTVDQIKHSIKGVTVSVVNRKYNDAFIPGEDSSLDTYEKKIDKEFPEFDWLKADPNKPSLKKQVATLLGIPNENIVEIFPVEMRLEPSIPIPTRGWADMFDDVKTPIFVAFLAIVSTFMLYRMVKKAQPEEEILDMPEFEEEAEKEDLPPLEEPKKDPRLRQVENRVKEIIDEDPAKAASLIRHWISKD